MSSEVEIICGPSRAVTGKAGEPVLCLPPGWRGLRLGRFPIPEQGEMGPARVATSMLLLATRGRGRRWYRYSHKTVELATVPGMIELYGHDFQRESARWEGQAGESIGVFLDPCDVNRLVRDAPDFNVRTTHELFDPKLQWLTQELLDEAQRGAPGGALYAEGLSCALIGRLAECYGAPRDAAAPVGHLPASGRRRVLDFIEAHLAEDLSVSVLAQEAGLSPDHFSRCFKASFGVSPHRYVLQRRLDAAVAMLRSTPLTIAEIALASGFSSQSHFTQALRQHTGKTPAAARLL